MTLASGLANEEGIRSVQPFHRARDTLPQRMQLFQRELNTVALRQQRPETAQLRPRALTKNLVELRTPLGGYRSPLRDVHLRILQIDVVEALAQNKIRPRALAQLIHMVDADDLVRAWARDLRAVAEHLADEALVLLLWSVVLFQDFVHLHPPSAGPGGQLSLNHLLQALVQPVEDSKTKTTPFRSESCQASNGIDPCHAGETYHIAVLID